MEACENRAEPVKAVNVKNSLPPEERFWQRYSPRLELPLSSASSVLLHLTAIGLLILGGMLVAQWPTHSRLEIDVVGDPGGGGQRRGADGPRHGPEKSEVVKDSEFSKPPTITMQTERQNLQKVDASQSSVLPKSESNDRWIAQTRVLSKELNSVDQAVDAKLRQFQLGNASKGQGGAGQRGGKGDGDGPGDGSGNKPGVGKLSKRQQRQLRWTMIFNTRDGDDYARQLHGLKAILAIPIAGESDKLCMVFEDFARKPAQGKRQDISSINRIYWIDDRADSVGSLTRFLGLSTIPPYIVAFFPEQLEKDLLEKELDYHHIPEERIVETRFEVRRAGRGYEPYVVDQQTKR